MRRPRQLPIRSPLAPPRAPRAAAHGRRPALAALGAVALGTGLGLATVAAAQTFSFENQDELAGKTCRSILAVLNPATTDLDISSSMRIGDANAVVISYVARPATGLAKSRKLVCAFKDKGGAFNRSRELVSVTSDGSPLGPARLRFLQRFWVGSSEAEAAAAALRSAKKP